MTTRKRLPKTDAVMGGLRLVPEPTPEPVPDLADKPTYRVSEVAAYYDVTERTVYLWIAHGHLQTEATPGGQTRVTRDSLDSCRFRPRSAQNL
jgi:excisionase family DNA binding protein